MYLEVVIEIHSFMQWNEYTVINSNLYFKWDGFFLWYQLSTLEEQQR
jgi:hypothetical protein